MTNQDDDQVSVALGAHIHSLMWRQRVTQLEMAKALGVSQGAVSKRLRGQVDLSVRDLRVMAGALGTTVPELWAEVVGEVATRAGGASGALRVQQARAASGEGAQRYLDGPYEAGKTPMAPANLTGTIEELYTPSDSNREPADYDDSVADLRRNVIDLATWRDRRAS